jgi:hypothetical protein
MADFHPDSIRNDTDSKTLTRQVMSEALATFLFLFLQDTLS